MITLSKALQLLSRLKYHSLQILQVQDCSKGVDQQVKIVTFQIGQGTNKVREKVVVKYPLREPDKIMNEVIGCQLSAKQKVPAPRILYFDESFLIQSYIKGEPMENTQNGKRVVFSIYKDLGRLLKKIHKNKGRGYGKVFNKRLIGQFQNKNYIKENMMAEIKYLKEKMFYPIEFIHSIENYLLKNSNLFTSIQSPTSLLHGDFCQSNILVFSSKIKGVVDFGDLQVGSPWEDFARLYIQHYGTHKWEALAQGYGELNLKEIEFYVVYFCLWRINSLVEKKSFRWQLRQISRMLGKIVKK